MTDIITKCVNANTIRKKVSADQAYQLITGNEPTFKGSEARVPCPICESKDNLSINKNGRHQCFTPGCISGSGSIDITISLGKAPGVNEACQFLGNAFGLAEIDQESPTNQQSSISEQTVSSQESEIKQSKALASHADYAQQIFNQCDEINETLPGHCTRKKIKPYSGRIAKEQINLQGKSFIQSGSLVLDYRDELGAITTIQYIAAEKIEGETDKYFLSKKALKDVGASLPVSWHTIGDFNNASIIGVTEGYSDAATCHEAKSYPIAIAGGANNVPTVCKALMKLHPNVRIINIADRGQAGDKAIQAAGCDWTQPAEHSDFNELYQAEGLQAVIDQLDGNLTSFSIQEPSNSKNTSLLSNQTDEQEIKRLAELNSFDYDRQRDEAAKKLKIRVGTLDKRVLTIRKELEPDSGADELVQGIEPWGDAVSGSQLLDEIRATFNKYCALPESGDVALTLWAFSSYTINSFRIFPKLCLSSPEKRCGKTTTLEVIGALAHRSLMASNISPSVLFRAVELWQPSLLIDEADTFINSNEELRGVINSGHTRSGAFVLRTEGDSGDRKPVKFSTWSPMAIAMIKTPPDTIRDRSIMIQLRRKLPGETVERMPFDIKEQSIELRQKCKRWADDNESTLRMAKPVIPLVGNDRAMDNWLPLLAIADIVGGDWVQLARVAMFNIEQIDDSEESIGIMLLNDIQTAFKRRNRDKIYSEDLINDLIKMEERPWCEWRRGQPMSKNSLAKLLNPYHIKSGTIRINATTQKGYYLNKFQDAFDRYLPMPPVQSVTSSQVNNYKGYSDFQNVTSNNGVTFQKTPETNSHTGCDGVTVQNRDIEKNDANEEEGGFRL